MLMITPVQWKDYKCVCDVKKAFNADNDFRVCAPIGEYSKWDTMACNKSDLVMYGVDEVKVRFNKLQNVVILKVEDE